MAAHTAPASSPRSEASSTLLFTAPHENSSEKTSQINEGSLAFPSGSLPLPLQSSSTSSFKQASSSLPSQLPTSPTAKPRTLGKRGRTYGTEPNPECPECGHDNTSFLGLRPSKAGERKPQYKCMCKEVTKCMQCPNACQPVEEGTVCSCPICACTCTRYTWVHAPQNVRRINDRVQVLGMAEVAKEREIKKVQTQARSPAKEKSDASEPTKDAPRDEWDACLRRLLRLYKAGKLTTSEFSDLCNYTGQALEKLIRFNYNFPDDALFLNLVTYSLKGSTDATQPAHE